VSDTSIRWARVHGGRAVHAFRLPPRLAGPWKQEVVDSVCGDHPAYPVTWLRGPGIGRMPCARCSDAVGLPPVRENA